ncbi:MAG: RNA-dependent RNA polymerase [Hangzhou phasmavirus 1]|nr:MAG: RNA-dependent RNA polymerase [Hangzhou phasmavirus 1]
MENYDPNDHESAFELYEQLLYERHEEAVELVHKIISRAGVIGTIGDVDVDGFLTENGYHEIGTRKTPDIIFLYDNNLYVGDIAVTRAIHQVVLIKNEKYKDIRERIMGSNPGLRVYGLDLVFDESGNNVIEKIKMLCAMVETAFIELEAIALAERFNNLNADIEYIQRTVVNADAFKDMVSTKHAGMDKETLDSIYEGIDETIKDYKPEFTEKQLFDMAYNSSIGYFDEATTKSSFKKDLEDSKRLIYEKIDDEFDDKNIKSPLQVILNPDSQDNEIGVELIETYVKDILMSGVETDILSLLPSLEQIGVMKEIEFEYSNRKDYQREETEKGVFNKKMVEKYGQTLPFFSPKEKLCRYNGKSLFQEYRDWYKEKNKSEKPKSLKSRQVKDCMEMSVKLIEYMGSTNNSNNRSTNLEFDKMKDYAEIRENESREMVIGEYERVNKMKGVLLSNAIVKWVNDIARLKTGKSVGLHYSTSVQSMGIVITFCDKSVYSMNPDWKFCSISRFSLDTDISLINELYVGRIARIIETGCYYYVLSKPQKLPLDKLNKLVNCDKEARTAIVSIVTMAKQLTKKDGKDLDEYARRVGGLLSLLSIDIHQHPSEILDLMKYMAGINHSEKSFVKTMLIDKRVKMYKTFLDIWLFENVISHAIENNKVGYRNKPNRVRMNERGIDSESYGIDGKFSSFFVLDFEHDSEELYLSECQVLFQIRPKKLYNMQYMNAASDKVLKNNIQARLEEEISPGSVSEGKINGTFDFNGKCNYSRDAIYYIMELFNREKMMFVNRHIAKGTGIARECCVNNVSLRGACLSSDEIKENMKKAELLKDTDKIKNNDIKRKAKIGKSQTALMGCLKMIENEIHQNNMKDAQVINILKKKKSNHQLYNMSPKEQRGGGRPIGSPDPITKQELYFTEMTVKAICNESNDNMLLKGQSKSKKLSIMTAKAITLSHSKNMKHVRHLVMDQSQWSEGDNVNKFIDAVRFCDNIERRHKTLMIKCFERMKNRIQFWPLKTNDSNAEELGYDNHSTLGTYGWVQGMLNFTSTWIHEAAIRWSIKLFNENNTDDHNVIVETAVNSDDSYNIIISDKVESIYRFIEFYQYIKKMVRIEVNKKKSYVTSLIGEMIQLYIAGGSTVNIWVKNVMSSFNLIMGVDMPKDILSAVGNINSLYRNGAPEYILCYLRAELKNMIDRLYNTSKGKFNDLTKIGIDRGNLPCELGGWPSYVSTYMLACTGSKAQLLHVYNMIKNEMANKRPYSNETILVRTSVALNFCKVNKKAKLTEEQLESERIGTPYNIKKAEGSHEDNEGKESRNTSLEKAVSDKKIKELFTVVKATVDENWLDMVDDRDQQKVTIEELEEDLNKAALILMKDINENAKEEAKASGIKEAEYELLATTYDVSYDNNLAKTGLGAVKYTVPIGKKIKKTADMLRSFNYQGSGLCGIIRERVDLQKAIGDIKESFVENAVIQSESNFTKSTRDRAAANSYAATQRCCYLIGINGRMSILGAYKLLRKLADRTIITKMNEINMKMTLRVLQDPTGLSSIARNVERSYKTSALVKNQKMKTNEIPRMLDDMTLSNDLATVLINIIDKDMIKKQGLIPKRPERLSADSRTVMEIYKDWFKFSRDKAATCRVIYFNHLKNKISRYHISAPLETGTMTEYLISCYEKCQRLDKRRLGVMTGKQPVVEGRQLELDNMFRELMAAMELIKFMVDNMNGDKEDYIDLIKLNKKTIREVLESDEIGVLYNGLNLYKKQLLSGLIFYLKGDTSYMRQIVKEAGVSVHWTKPQKLFHTIMGGEKTKYYDGYFEVEIQKGRNVIIVKGEPGNLTEISGNTTDKDVIIDCLSHFYMRNEFHGFPKITKYEEWGNTPFWGSKITNSTHIIKYRRNYATELKPNLDAQTINLKQMLKIENLLDETVMSKNNIPYNYIPTLVGTHDSRINYRSFSIEKDYVYGSFITNSQVIRTDEKTGARNMAKVSREVKKRLFQLKYKINSVGFKTINTGNLMIGEHNVNGLIKHNLLIHLLRNTMKLASKRDIEEYIREYGTLGSMLIRIIQGGSELYLKKPEEEDYIEINIGTDENEMIMKDMEIEILDDNDDEKLIGVEITGMPILHNMMRRNIISRRAYYGMKAFIEGFSIGIIDDELIYDNEKMDTILYLETANDDDEASIYIKSLKDIIITSELMDIDLRKQGIINKITNMEIDTRSDSYSYYLSIKSLLSDKMVKGSSSQGGSSIEIDLGSNIEDYEIEM